jgi:cytochrome c553
VNAALSRALILLGLTTLPAMADDQPSQPQLGREKARYRTTCHDLDGLRQGGEMPAIGGHDYDELLYNMGKYRRAQRFHPVMTVMMQTLDVADMAEVAAYFARMDQSSLEQAGPYRAR